VRHRPQTFSPSVGSGAPSHSMRPRHVVPQAQRGLAPTTMCHGPRERPRSRTLRPHSVLVIVRARLTAEPSHHMTHRVAGCGDSDSPCSAGTRGIAHTCGRCRQPPARPRSSSDPASIATQRLDHNVSQCAPLSRRASSSLRLHVLRDSEARHGRLWLVRHAPNGSGVHTPTLAGVHTPRKGWSRDAHRHPRRAPPPRRRPR
jgi:hypothetical protein